MSVHESGMIIPLEMPLFICVIHLLFWDLQNCVGTSVEPSELQQVYSSRENMKYQTDRFQGLKVSPTLQHLLVPKWVLSQPCFY